MTTVSNTNSSTSYAYTGTETTVAHTTFQSASYTAGATFSEADARLFVSDLYYEYLGRAPDQVGHDWWTDALVSGQNTPEGIRAGFYNSAEAAAYRAERGIQESGFPPGTRLVLEDIETNQGPRQQVVLFYGGGGGVVLGFVGEFDMAPYSGLPYSNETLGDGYFEDVVEFNDPLPIGGFPVDPAFVAYDASGQPANDDRYRWRPVGAVDSTGQSGLTKAIQNAFTAIVSNIQGIFGVSDELSAVVAPIDAASFAAAIAKTPNLAQNLIGTAGDPARIVITADRSTIGLSGQYYFTTKTHVGTDNHGTPLYGSNGQRIDTVELIAHKYDPAKMKQSFGALFQVSEAADMTMPPLAARFLKGFVNGVIDSVLEPGKQTRDLAFALASVIYNEVIKKPNEPGWYPDMISGVAEAYNAGQSQARLIAQQVPVIGTVIDGIDVAQLLQSGDSGDRIEVIGMFAASVLLKNTKQALGKHGLTLDDVNRANVGPTSDVGLVGFSALSETDSTWRQNIFKGRAFDTQRIPFYTYNQVYLINPAGGYHKLDSYIPDKEIVSRKYTQFSEISEATATNYLREFTTKYDTGARIASVPTTPAALLNKTLSGSLYMEVPVQTSPIPASVKNMATSLGIKIRDTNGTIYNPF